MSGVTPEDRDDFMQANIDDLNAALSHLGFDNMEDFHQWALDENELKRFDQLCLLLTRHRQAAYAAGRDAERERCLAIVQRCSAEGVLARSIIDTAIRSAAIAAAGGSAG